jgi:hypothetical protein
MERPIQAAVLDRLGDLRRGDLRHAVQVGDGARYLEDAGVGAGAGVCSLMVNLE